MSKFSKTVVLLFVMAAMAAIAACGGAQPQTVTVVETVVVEKEVEVEKEVIKEVSPIIYNSNRSDPDVRAMDEKLVALFNEMNPDTPLDHSTVDHEGFKQAIRAYLIAEPAPDVMTWFAGNRARFFIDNGLIMDVSDVWEEAGWNEDFPKGFLAMSSVDDKQYFVPSDWYWWGIFYRKSIFEENGVTPPETWDELLTACDTLHGNGVIPITIGTKFRWTAAGWFDYLNMRTNGPEFHLDLMLGKESYEDPRVRATFDHWNELFEHNCFIEDAAAYSWQEALDPMIQGDAAMYLIGQFVMGLLPEDVQEDMDFFQFPIIDPDMPIGEDAPTDGYFMSVNAKNPEGGKEFLKFLGSVEAQTLVVEELGRLPVHKKVDRSLFSPMQQKGLDMIDTADLVLQFYDRDTTPEMADVGMNGFMSFWDDPTAVDDIMAEMEATRQEIFVEE